MPRFTPSANRSPGPQIQRPEAVARGDVPAIIARPTISAMRGPEQLMCMASIVVGVVFLCRKVGLGRLRSTLELQLDGSEDEEEDQQKACRQRGRPKKASGRQAGIFFREAPGVRHVFRQDLPTLCAEGREEGA